VSALIHTFGALARRSPNPRALLPAFSAAVLAFNAGGDASALTVYGSPSGLSGPGSCLGETLGQPGGDEVCAGGAQGLAGAQAVAVSPDGANVYVAGEGAVVALTRERASGALRPALSPSARACVAASVGYRCAIIDRALSGADALAVSRDGRFVYVGASDTASVSAFRRARHGVLVRVAAADGGYFGCVAGRPLAGKARRPCAAGASGLAGVGALAISPDGRYLYAVSYGLAPGEDSIVVLARDPDSGALRPLSGRHGCVQSLPGRGCIALAGLEGASAITISPDGRYAYVASQLSGAVRAFVRDRATGTLQPMYKRGSCISSDDHAPGDVACAVRVAQLSGARSIALSPDGRELYVAAFDPGAVVVLGRDPTSGRLAARRSSCLQALPDPGCPVALPSLRGAAAVAMATNGRAVYVIGEGANSLVELLRDPADGALTFAGDTPTVVDSLSGPAGLAVAPGGASIYVVSPFQGDVAAFTA
jgi:6-phosphogluconolactonase (cycloisomerase 2 family)